MIKFILLSPPRTGSQLLLSGLADPDNSIYNEIFTHKIYTDEYSKNHNDFNERYNKPNKYINYFLNKSKTKIGGVKILSNTFPEKALNMIMKESYKFIYMYRYNVFETAISLAFAHHTNLWTLNKTIKGRVSTFKNTQPFAVDEKKFELWLINTYNQSKTCLKLLKDLKCQHVALSYEALYHDGKVDLDQINTVREFLGLQKLTSFDPVLVKQCSDDMYSKVTNMKVLKDKFSAKYGYVGSNEIPAVWK